MPKSLTVLPPEIDQSRHESQISTRLPWRKRIVKHINGFDVNVPTRVRTSARSVTPIY
jgi:hypothetical protein